MDIEITASRMSEAAAIFERIAATTEDGKPMLAHLTEQLREAEKERFAGKGVRWKKFAASTIEQRQGIPGAGPMIRTGALMRSLTAPVDKNRVVKITPTSLSFGTKLFYARFHQKGTKHEPKRIIAGLTRPQRTAIIDRLRHLILGGDL